jgi:hypothetical protein
MAQAAANPTTSRFHNLSDVALADAIGHADSVLKGAEAECKALKDEFKRRGLVEVAGDNFTVTATEQIAGRLDVNAVKEHLGDSWRRFEVATVSTVIRIKSVTLRAKNQSIARLFSDPTLRTAFRRAEDSGLDASITFAVPPDRPNALTGGAAAEREPEGVS